MIEISIIGLVIVILSSIIAAFAIVGLVTWRFGKHLVDDVGDSMKRRKK